MGGSLFFGSIVLKMQREADTLSRCKPDNLFFCIHLCFYAERNNAPRHSVADVQVEHDRKFRSADDFGQQLFVFWCIYLIHRFPDQDT